MCQSSLYIYFWLLSITQTNINSFLPQDTLVVPLSSHTLSTTYTNLVKRITLTTDGCAVLPPIYQHPLLRTTRQYPTLPPPFQRKLAPYPTKMRATSALTLLGTGFSAFTTATSFGVPGTNALNLRYAVS